MEVNFRLRVKVGVLLKQCETNEHGYLYVNFYLHSFSISFCIRKLKIVGQFDPPLPHDIEGPATTMSKRVKTSMKNPCNIHETATKHFLNSTRKKKDYS